MNFQIKKARLNYLTEETLKQKYRDFIWMFFEKTTYLLISCLKNIENKSEENAKEQLKSINPFTKIISPNDNLDELLSNQTLSNICKSLLRNKKIVASKIPVHNSYISYSKTKEETLEHMLSNLSPTGIKIKIRILQEWGGSHWDIEFYKNDNMDHFIYCEEIGKLKMKFIFNENGVQ